MAEPIIILAVWWNLYVIALPCVIDLEFNDPERNQDSLHFTSVLIKVKLIFVGYVKNSDIGIWRCQTKTHDGFRPIILAVA